MVKESVKNKKGDLIKKLEEKIISLRDLRFGVAGSKSKNVKQAGSIKREIARIKTALNKNK